MCLSLSLLEIAFLSILVHNAVHTTAIPAVRTARVANRIDTNNNSMYVQDIMRLSKAAEMQNYMNENMNPCNNFYAFACGNWPKINPANTIETLTTGLFEVMSKALHLKVERMLKAGPEPGDTSIDKKVKDFYESCIKMGKQRDGYRAKLTEIIAEFGEMPALSGNSWNEAQFDWLEAIANISHKYGQDIIIGLDILPDFAMNTVNRVYIGQPEFPLESKTMYLDGVTAIYRAAYKEKIAKDLRQHLGMKEKIARQTAHDIVEFEVELARGMDDEKLGLGLDELSHLTTVAEMHQKYAPTIDIEKLVRITLGEVVTEPVYEFVEQYLKNLQEVMQRTSKQTVANYIMYTLLEDFQLKMAKTQAKQDKVCIETTQKYFAKNLDNMIYRRYNNDITERDVNLIWNEIKQTFRSELKSNKLNWITRETREVAVTKLDAMRLEINSYEKDNFTEEFGELPIVSDDYIANIKHIVELSSRKAIAELHQKPKPLEAGTILSYTPANIIMENMVKVPVALLQPYYLWAANYPKALKFATLGSLIGHELIHGFDDNGRKFDKDGNHFNWWDDASANSFNQRTQCFAEQYSKFSYGGRFLPKSVSQSENIADNGGVRIAYASYLKWLQAANDNKTDLHMETLPSLNFTSKQLFFLSYAQVWCNDAHPRVRDLQTSTDTHVPGMFRVNGPLSNFPEFAKEFNCDRGTVMNPQTKCEIY